MNSDAQAQEAPNTATISTTMNAYTRLKPFTFVTNHPIPDFSNLKPDQVYVKILAAAINPVDYKAP